MNKTNNIFYPVHIAIIMDGNGRWAKKKNLPRIAGHQKGSKRAKEIIEVAIELNLKYLTLFAFSSENWSRPKSEVNDLMVLLNNYLNKETEQYLKRNVKLRVIGNRNRLQSSIVKRIEQIEHITINNNGLQLTIALDYGGREDIIFAMKEIYKSYVNKKINFNEINISSLVKKPARGIIPAKERAPIVKALAVIFMFFLNPPKLQQSVRLPVLCITLPAHKNNKDLDNP